MLRGIVFCVVCIGIYLMDFLYVWEMDILDTWKLFTCLKRYIRRKGIFFNFFELLSLFIVNILFLMMILILLNISHTNLIISSINSIKSLTIILFIIRDHIMMIILIFLFNILMMRSRLFVFIIKCFIIFLWKNLGLYVVYYLLHIFVRGFYICILFN
jgi:hypothetical protein